MKTDEWDFTKPTVIVRPTQDVIAEQKATIEALEKALRPFAEAARCYDDDVRGSNMPRVGVWYGWKMGKGVEAELTVEHLRDARAAISALKEKG